MYVTVRYNRYKVVKKFMNVNRTWLKKLRDQRNMTQNEVAKRAGIERAYYTMIEQGYRSPSVKVAKDIGSVLGFDWTIFFENKSNEMKHNEQVI